MYQQSPPIGQHMQQTQRRLYDSWIKLGIPLPRQIEMQPTDWRHLTDLAQVKTGRRQSGESLLKYHLHVMLAHANAEQNDNIVHTIDGIVGLRQHIDWLYKQEQQEEDNKMRKRYMPTTSRRSFCTLRRATRRGSDSWFTFGRPSQAEFEQFASRETILLLHRTMLGVRTTALCAGRGISVRSDVYAANLQLVRDVCSIQFNS